MDAVEWDHGIALTDGSVVHFNVGTRAYGDRWATVDSVDWPKIKGTRWRATKRKKAIIYLTNPLRGRKVRERKETFPRTDHVHPVPPLLP